MPVLNGIVSGFTPIPIYFLKLNLYRDLPEIGYWFLVVLSGILSFAGVYNYLKKHKFFQNGFTRSGEDEMQKNYDETLLKFVKYIPAPVAMFDKEMRYLAVSDRWLEDFGIKNQDVLGKTFYEVIPSTSDEWKDIHQTSLTGISQKFEEEPFNTSEGKQEWIHCEIHPWYEANSREIGGVIIFSELITKRKETEETLKKAKEMAEEASRSKSNFIANMSHELRTPLTSILGYTQILEIDSDLGSEQLNQIKEIKKSGEYLLGLINDILALSKIETEQVAFEGENIDVRKFFEEVITDKSEKFKDHHNEVSVELNGGMSADIYTDREKFEIIIKNLIDNAFKFTTDGKITITASMKHIEGTGANGLLSVVISDTGIGIPKNKIESIFRPFTQLQKQYNQGTGLGLSVAHRLTQFLGGSLTVKSEPGKGSEFTVKVPVQIKVLEKESEESRTIEFTEPEEEKEELTPKEVGEYIKSLDPKSVEIIREALELQDLETLSNLEQKLGIDGDNEALAKLKECAADFDYMFITNVSKEIER